MVYYFKVCDNLFTRNDADMNEDEQTTLYMGKDKFENDYLIKHSNDENIWFHVDNMSSAHVYLQLTKKQLIENLGFKDLTIEDSLLHIIGQLTKANSIKGNKLNNITIIYTNVKNLLTDGSMDVGTVSFKNPKLVKRIFIEQRNNQIINALNKTKSEISTETFIENQKQLEKEILSHRKIEETKLNELSKQKQKDLEQKKDPYKDLFSEENMQLSNNEGKDENWVEDDFW
ncbi:unnamed protein product [Candida verbasci]|uniref:NFACT RNA-binding domain-containing protein n=1 Tax=Candida verbasci TaxID=1227364 RepID=A0A9W4U021_9ASCO|nr:unnamed protein product [Candida verbasci]